MGWGEGNATGNRVFKLKKVNAEYKRTECLNYVVKVNSNKEAWKQNRSNGT